MDALVDRLQAGLGDRYTIERELGRGGMATVHLAHDRKHKRQVAIKVLRPEVAAAIGAQRFLREIEIAAQLIHPHILPLHDSGEASGFLYYVMPYLQGGSLRVRLERERQLPLDEALHIAREVADALAHAHGQGIIHRDIKPENILFEAGHAVVGDFGIARAITAAGGDMLTASGIAVGTPAYMSPEQAVGSVDLDGRSDVYSLACVLYETLAGVPPFGGATAQAAVAGHLTGTVRPLGEFRRDITPTVTQTIGRALAKDPNDRFGGATEFRDAMSAASTSNARRAGHPLRVAGLYGLASAAILAVTFFLTIQLGLPNWVYSSAVALLVIGFPIVVATGLAERQRAIGTAAGGLRGLLTWRRALTGGGVAFGALGAGAAVYTAMRLLGLGPVGTLVASGVLENRERLILADFENRTADSTLGRSLTAAFRVDLSESPTVRLMDPVTMAGALGRMQRLPVPSLDAALARELALRENVKAVVRGEVDPVGRGYVLSVSLIAAADGHVLAALRETATDDAALIGALDRLSRRLRERIGESLKSIRAGPPLEQVTTASLDALRRYSNAARAEEQGDYEHAAAGYQEATAIDTGFAMAYRKLAMMFAHSGASDSAIAAAASRAYRHRDRLPEIERYLVTAQHHELAWDWHEATSAYRSVLERDPDNIIALTNLAWMLIRGRQWREAEALAIRATGVSPLAIGFSIVAVAQMGQGRYTDAGATLERMARVAPHNPLVLLTRFALEASRGSYAAAEQELHQLRGEQASSAAWRAVASSGLAWLDEVRGNLGQAARDLDNFMVESEQRRVARDYVAGAVWRGLLDVRYRHQPSVGAKLVETALARHPMGSMPALDRPYIALAEFYAEVGQPDVARRLLADYERLVPQQSRSADPEALAVRGAIALAEGRPQDAVLAYRAWTEQALLPTEGLFELATAHERAHQPDSALATYQRAVSTPGLKTWLGVVNVGQAYGLAASLARLGELYEARRDGSKAREYYRRFADLWKDADAELQPTLARARAALKRVSGESPPR